MAIGSSPSLFDRESPNLLSIMLPSFRAYLKESSMLATYFKEPRTLAVFRCGPAGSQLDRFIIWLEIRGYRRACIRRHSREAHRFAVWAQSEGLTVCNLDQNTLHQFQNHLEKRKMLRKPNGDHSSAWFPCICRFP